MSLEQEFDRRKARLRGPRAVTIVFGIGLLGICACQSTGDWTSGWNHHPGSRDAQWPPAPAEIPTAKAPTPQQTTGGIVQAGYQQPVCPPTGGPPCRIENAPYSRAHPRIPLQHMSPEEYEQAELLAQGGPAVVYRDEYLFDGGDRAAPVHYDDFRRHGLDTEDTIAEYRDHTGKFKMKPSTRVAIYAPRFAAVRTISVPTAGIGWKKVGSLDEDVHAAGFGIRTGTAHHKGRAVPIAARVRTRGSGIDADARLVTGRHLTRMATSRKNVVPIENLAFLRTGTFERTEKAILALGIQAAAVWTKRRYPVAMASSRKSGEVSARAHFEEYVGREPMLTTPGKLRIVKLADKKDAKPGEVITFTIRYDNLGERELTNVRIIDNLTPRLDLVDNSGSSDRPGKASVERNQEGSVILKFELTDPLPGGEGGVLKFKAKVR